MLASFGSGIFLSRAASLATLTRFGRLGWGSLIASEGAALAVEVPAMVFTRRFGAPWLRRNLALEGPLGVRAFGGLRFGAELGSLMLGHRLNAAIGLEQPMS